MTKIFSGLVALRMLTDGPFAFEISGVKSSAVISALLVVLALFSSIGQGSRHFVGFFIATSLFLASSFQASLHFGSSPLEECFRLVSVMAVFTFFASRRGTLQKREPLLLAMVQVTYPEIRPTHWFGDSSIGSTFGRTFWTTHFSGSDMEQQQLGVLQ